MSENYETALPASIQLPLKNLRKHLAIAPSTSDWFSLLKPLDNISFVTHSLQSTDHWLSKNRIHLNRISNREVWELETEASPVQTLVQNSIISAGQSLGYVCKTSMVWSLISIALVFWICKQLSAFDLKGFKAIQAQFTINLSDEADAQLKTATEILFVTLAVYVARCHIPEGSMAVS